MKEEFFKKISNKLDELLKLHDGWDGYQGKSITNETILDIEEFLLLIYVDGLPIPLIVPGSDGSIQIEWHEKGIDLEIDIISKEFVRIYANIRVHLEDADEFILNLNNIDNSKLHKLNYYIEQLIVE